jgi:transposase
MKYSGIDLHSNNCVVVVTDEQDRVLVSKRLPNQLEAIIALLAPHRDELSGVVVESTYNWYWLVDGLQAAGFVVHLANTTAMVRYEGLKHSDDESDAIQLARLLRLNILPVGHIMEKAARATRDLARKRMQLVQDRSRHVVAIENIMNRETGARLTANVVKRLTAQAVDEMPFHEDVRLAIQANSAIVRSLNAEIERIETRLHARVSPRPETALLKTAPGIGAILANVILLETGPIRRFAEVGNYASYCRCVDSKRVSNGKKKGEGNTKNGNKYLAWAYVEAAHFALRFCPEAKRFYERKKAKTNGIVAIKALAHKLARACYHMLREGAAFDLQRCFA